MEKSKTFVHPNGGLLNTQEVRELLFRYWDLSETEKKSFDRTKDREDLKQQYKKWKDKP